MKKIAILSMVAILNLSCNAQENKKEATGDLFSDDSLFTKRFFDDDFFDSDFGEDFMDIDRIRKRMETMQQRFLERYQSEFENLENEPTQERS